METSEEVNRRSARGMDIHQDGTVFLDNVAPGGEYFSLMMLHAIRRLEKLVPVTYDDNRIQRNCRREEPCRNIAAQDQEEKYFSGEFHE
jgi:hypothetical protein